MYSGFVLYYGIKVHITDLEIYNILDLQDEDSYDDMSLSEFAEALSSQISEDGLSLVEVNTQPCCFSDDGNIFLAVNLGEYKVQYMDYIGSFNSMENFQRRHRQKLNDMHAFFFKNQSKIELELSHLKEAYPYLMDYANRFYTIANDCTCV